MDRLRERLAQGARRATSSTRADAARADRVTQPLRSLSAVPHGVPDLERFAADVAARLSAGAWPGSVVTRSGDSVFVARAPGRLDVMGGIADYSGALVLQWPIREATCAAVQVHPERVLRIVSLSDTGTSRHCTVPLDAIAPGGSPASYAAARAWFSADAERHWAAYVAG